MSLLRILSKHFIFFGIFFLVVSLGLFGLFAPVKTTILGYAISFASLDNPSRISLLLILLGIFFGWVGNRPAGLSNRSLLFVIFSLVFIAHLSSPVITSTDSRYVLPAAKSLLIEGNLRLDEYKEMINKDNDYRIEIISGHPYNLFPIGTSLLSLPIVFWYDNELIKSSPEGIERFIASLWVAITCIFIYLIAFQILGNRKYSLFSIFIFAFCTSSWSTASRALWQHSPSMLMLTVALYLIILAQKKPYLVQFSSLPLAFSFLIRPTNSISILLFSTFILIKYRRYFLQYFFWSLIIAGPFLIFNYLVYQSLLPSYYSLQKITSGSTFFEALLANLISPNRGLFVFTPVLLFSFYGCFLKIKNRTFELLDFTLAMIIVLHWIAVSGYWHWWAGHSFGPRVFTDIIPFFIYFLLPVFPAWSQSTGIKKNVLSVFIILLIIVSFFIHYRGAFVGDFWSGSPVSVDIKPARVWDWHDLQFLRGRPTQ